MVEVTGAQRSRKPSSEARHTFSRVAGRWLRWQCQLLNDVQFAAVVDASGLSTGAGIPSTLLIASVGEARIPLIAAEDPAKYKSFSVHGMSCWQIPLNFPGRSIVVIVHMGALSAPAQTAADRLLQWGALNLVDWLADAAPGKSAPLPPMQAMLSQKTLHAAAACWVDDVQRRTCARRVSVGWFEGGRSELLAVSGVTALDTRRALPRALLAAMGECIHVGKPVHYPRTYPGAADALCDTVKHRQLHQLYGEQHILSLPLTCADFMNSDSQHGSDAAMRSYRSIGVLMLEMNAEQVAAVPLDSLLDEVAMAAPVLLTLNERKPGAGLFVRRCVQGLHQRLFRPATQMQRRIAWAVLAMVLVVACFPFSHYATLRGEIYGSDRQVLAATHQGYLESASARAGDRVREGQVLARFDHTRLRLERDTWVSELARIDSALVQAMSERDKPSIGRLRAEQAAAKAEMELIDHQITQSDIVAPFDGILVSGDLDDQLGSSVDAGETLFQIASLNDYTLQLEVPEHQAALVSLGSTGDMRFAALPSAEYALEVESSVPVAIPEEGRNVFRMQASLQGDTESIRPGMTGVAKVDIGRRPLVVRAFDLVRGRLHYWWWSFGA